MKNRIFGNGSGKGIVHRSPLAPGWVIYHVGEPPPAAEDVPFALNHHLMQDLQEHPSIRVRAALPILQGGNTVAIHLWYDDLAAEHEEGEG